MLFYFYFCFIKLAFSNTLFVELSNEFEPYSRSATYSTVKTLWFNQTLDHENPYSNTFKQRYYVNTEHYKLGGPVFIYIGGEASLSSGSVLGGNILQLARENNGMLFGLEHRFYGASQPFDKWTVDNLKYLSSLNGVKDAGNFIKKVTNPTTNKPFEDTKWITVGGSYPGSLSAWIRQEYPNSVFVGYASSAPVLATEDFYKYDQVITSALGSKCANEMNSIRQYMDDSYKNRQEFIKLKSDFECNEVEDNILFLSAYADMIAGIVQYNSPMSIPNIDTLCSGLNNQTDVKLKLNHIINQTKLFRNKINKSCKDIAGLEELKEIKVNSQSNIRQWTYQCCKEYGYWQTAPKYGISTRSRKLTVNWANKFYCSESIYGKEIGPPDTKFINARFKALNNNTPRTIWVNGDADPWMSLSITNIQKSSLNRPIYLIEKGSHGNDLGSDKSTDSTSLTEIRKNIRADIFRMLNE